MSRSSENRPAPEVQPARGRGGRPRLHASPAARQKAYRRRLRLKAAAYDALSREGTPPSAPDEETGKPQTGPELFAALVANGFIGALAGREEEIGDSVEYARKLRERAWTQRHE